MRYEGPIYRPPSEADSLLIQVTVGCPHNKCTFCMVYKNGPRYKVRDMEDVKEDLLHARDVYGPHVNALFFPAGNTIAVKTDMLCEICRFSRKVFPKLERITVYGSSQYILKKGLDGLRKLKKAGLSRIHVGLESGDDVILKHIRKGATAHEQIQACQWIKKAGMEVSVYVVVGIGSKKRTDEHAVNTAIALNQISPDFIRLRTFVPKINTPLLKEVEAGSFEMLSPHRALIETKNLVKELDTKSLLLSDHYTNYLNLEGRLPEDKNKITAQIEEGLAVEESRYRPFFVGRQ